LNLAGTFASKCLQMPLHCHYNTNQLFLQHRISIMKASSASTSHMPSMLVDAQNSWSNNIQTPEDDYTLFDMNDHGDILSLGEESLNHGDFIEVDVEFDLVIAQDNVRHAILKLYLFFKDIVCLLP
ncbi:hypothetical protein BKA82DRAFT_3940022, partial [Pisolithus tinctorius]